MSCPYITHKEVEVKIASIEKKIKNNAEYFGQVFDSLANSESVKDWSKVWHGQMKIVCGNCNKAIKIRKRPNYLEGGVIQYVDPHICCDKNETLVSE